MKKISVLVPIYNVEKYLPECLDSLIAQTLKDIEIICINDGSTDSSPQIIKRYAKKDSRIIVINKKNSGYGDSMNQGLAKATGEYIAIVESDDYIDEDACENLYRLAKKHNADIVRANYYHHTDASDEIHYSIQKQHLDQPMNIDEDPSILYEAPAIWSAIYRRSFLKKNHVEFLPTPGASYQDTGFNMKALCSAERIVYTDKAYLHYRTDNSNSSVKSRDKMDYVLKEYAEIETYLQEINASDKIKGIAQAAKFGAFHWNLLRLPRSLALGFLQRVKKDYSEANQQGLLHKDYFPKKYWYALQIILNCPVSVYYALIAARKHLKRT